MLQKARRQSLGAKGAAGTMMLALLESEACATGCKRSGPEAHFGETNPRCRNTTVVVPGSPGCDCSWSAPCYFPVIYRSGLCCRRPVHAVGAARSHARAASRNPRPGCFPAARLGLASPTLEPFANT